jgi:hypothetical protein
MKTFSLLCAAIVVTSGSGFVDAADVIAAAANDRTLQESVIPVTMERKGGRAEVSAREKTVLEEVTKTMTGGGRCLKFAREVCPDDKGVQAEPTESPSTKHEDDDEDDDNRRSLAQNHRATSGLRHRRSTAEASVARQLQSGGGAIDTGVAHEYEYGEYVSSQTFW